MQRRHLLMSGTGSAALALTAFNSRPAAANGRSKGRVRTGADRLAARNFGDLQGHRIGVITNPTGVLADLSHLVDVMAEHPAVDLRAVFGPEHGFRGTAQATHGEPYFIDEKTGLPVYDTFEKTPAELATIFEEADVDTIIFDIQDVGVRFYTYIWTMTDSMQGAQASGKRIIILDRPNPITGMESRGPVLDPAFASTIGRAPIPQQHAMTVAELASMFNDTFLPKPVDLEVIQMRGWRREMEWEQTGLSWVPPSPNMPTVDTAFSYPGSCLFAGTNLSQGRGTTKPFEIVGAPFMDHRWAAALSDLGLPGVQFREAYFVPTFSTYVSENCCGIQIVVTDRARFDAVRLGIALLSTARELYPETAWLQVEGGAFWIDHLTGTDQVRQQLDRGVDLAGIERDWQPSLRAFDRQRQRYLRY